MHLLHNLTEVMMGLRHKVFWPPFALLMTAVVFSFLQAEAFNESLKLVNDWILGQFGGLFSWTSFVMFLVCFATFFSPLAGVRIGGKNSEPLLNRWQWFSITLCTTVAIGILFWGTAEPIYHLVDPPAFSGEAKNTPGAARFALETMFLHWSFTPYAIYTIPALVFALAFYNHEASYSLQSLLDPLVGGRVSPEGRKRIGSVIDALCLYSLVAGMAAALGAGMLILAGGAERLFGIPTSPLSLAVITGAIVITYTISSVSGLMKGIRLLSDWNIKVFFALCLFVLIFGPTAYIFQMGVSALPRYLVEVLPRTAALGTSEADRPWLNSWSVFYWAVWMAWAPITALFLGRLARGYTVREFIVFNLILPALFSIVWMSVFSGSSLYYQMEGVDLYSLMKDRGTEHVIYEIFSKLPWATTTMYIFFFVSFLSFVTAADSNTSAMAAISTSGISSEEPEGSLFVKLLWGLAVGIVAWVMVSFNGIEGIKISSNLGGVPALFLLMAVTASLIVLVVRSYRKGPALNQE